MASRIDSPPPSMQVAARPLMPGEPAPWFSAPTTTIANFNFSTVAGRRIVLCVFGSLAHPAGREILAGFAAFRDRFDDANTCFFGISVDPNDQDKIKEEIPGIRYFLDHSSALTARLGGLVDRGQGRFDLRPVTYLLDPNLRVIATFGAHQPAEQAARVIKVLDALPPLFPMRPADPHAPVLLLPRVFEPDFCRKLIAGYAAHGGKDSGYMTERDGKTVGVIDYGHKRRYDWEIDDAAIRQEARRKIERRLVPEIRKAFQFDATRMERYIVACYDGGVGGYFRAHRDNTTKGTAHRRFAVTINLNAEEYEGGDLRFPEWGPQLFRAPTGGAVVFSCSLQHEAMPVKRGVRYAFLPFLYDEAAAKIREQNNPFLADPDKQYRDAKPGEG